MNRLANLLLLLVVGICGFSFWLARGRPVPGFLESKGIGSAPVAIQMADPLDEPVHLRVLNGTQLSGLAGQVALLLPGLGCVIEGVGNADSWPDSPSVLINRRLSEARARQLAEILGGIPILREWDARTTEDAVLVLGLDHERIQAVLFSAASP